MLFSLSNIDLLSLDSLEVTFSAPIIIGSSLTSPSSYRITKTADTNSVVAVRRVVLPKTSTISTSSVILVTDNLIEEVEYTLSIVPADLLGIDGQYIDVTIYGVFIGSQTKFDLMASNLPDHYSLYHGGNLRALLQSISNSDNVIGGANITEVIYDYLTVDGVYVTQDGTPMTL